MANSQLKIAAETRKVKGKKTKQLRNSGIIPGVIYGPNRESTEVQFERKPLIDIITEARSSSLVNITVDGKEVSAFLQEVQSNPRNRQVSHVSFYEPDHSKPVTMDIEFTTTGIAPAIKNNLGILFLAMDSVLVRALPKDLVDVITIDITNLNEVGDTIRLSDIELPEGVELAYPKESKRTIVTITNFQKEIVEEEIEETEGEEGDEDEEGEEGSESAEGEGEEAPTEE